MSIAGLVASQPAPAASPWYVDGSLGSVRTENRSFSGPVSVPPVHDLPVTNTSSFTGGAIVDLGLGYRLPHGLRVEGELGYAHFALAGAAPVAGGIAAGILNGSHRTIVSGGARDLFTATAGLFYDLPFSGRIRPYLGAGAGYYNLQAASGHFIVDGQTLSVPGGTFNCPMIFAEAGVSIALDAHWAVVPAYRFQYLMAPGNPSFDQHVVKLGLRYSF